VCNCSMTRHVRNICDKEYIEIIRKVSNDRLKKIYDREHKILLSLLMSHQLIFVLSFLFNPFFSVVLRRSERERERKLSGWWYLIVK